MGPSWSLVIRAGEAGPVGGDDAERSRRRVMDAPDLLREDGPPRGVAQARERGAVTARRGCLAAWL